MFSKRTNWNFEENKLSLLLKALKRDGKPIIDLSESNPTHCNFKYLADTQLLSPFMHPDNLLYHPAPKGTKEARTVIQSYYLEKNIQIDPERIFLTAGTSESYNHILRLLTDSGNRIAVPRPSYPLFNFIANLNDVILDYYPMRYEKAKWRIDFNAFSETLHPATKAIIAVHPNNPTGSFVKIKERNELIRTAQSKSLALISDEVFLDYGFKNDSERAVSLSNTTEVLTFTLGGISKLLGLPQMKLSWMVLSGPEKIVSQTTERLEIILDTYLSVSAPSQKALPHWLSCKDRIQKEIKERINVNQSWLAKRVASEPNISGLESEGGWYAILKLPKLKTEEEWTLDFLEKDRVFVHPGYFFDWEDEAHIVLSLLPECAQFQEGCDRLIKRSSSFQSS